MLTRNIVAFANGLGIFNCVFVRLHPYKSLRISYMYEGHPISSDDDPIKQNLFL